MQHNMVIKIICYPELDEMMHIDGNKDESKDVAHKTFIKAPIKCKRGPLSNNGESGFKLLQPGDRSTTNTHGRSQDAQERKLGKTEEAKNV